MLKSHPFSLFAWPKGYLCVYTRRLSSSWNMVWLVEFSRGRIWRMTPQSEPLSLIPVPSSMLISPKPTWKLCISDMNCIKDSILLHYLHRSRKNIQQFWDNWLTTEPGERILGPDCGVIIHLTVVRWEPPPRESQNGILTGYKIKWRRAGSKNTQTVSTDGSRRLFALTGELQGALTHQTNAQQISIYEICTF